jgi:hypothetical protein
MTTTAIRQKLQTFFETADDKKVRAMYTLFEHEIEDGNWQYTDEFKAELDRRTAAYKNGTAKLISAVRVR